MKERGGFCLERETGEGKIVRTGGRRGKLETEGAI